MPDTTGFCVGDSAFIEIKQSLEKNASTEWRGKSIGIIYNTKKVKVKSLNEKIYLKVSSGKNTYLDSTIVKLYSRRRAPGSCLLVNISTAVPKCDRTLILNKGDHPFIDRESFVFYRKALVEPANRLESLVATAVYKAHAPADARQENSGINGRVCIHIWRDAEGRQTVWDATKW